MEFHRLLCHVTKRTITYSSQWLAHSCAQIFHFPFKVQDNCFCRPAALHQRAECVDPDAGQLADRENPEPQLGGRLQGSHHHPPPHVLWQ